MSAAPKNPALGVIILGAGASVRMGKPKLLLPWADTTVIGQIISIWRELGAGQITVVMRPNDVVLGVELDRLNVPQLNRIQNPQPERGMFSSILCAAGWEGWRPEISSWAIVLGDQPHLQAKPLRQLLAFHTQNLDRICQPTTGGHAGHPVILPPSAFEQLKTTRAATLKDFLKLMAASCVQCEINDPGLLLDLDTPEDYIRLQSR
ncbi:MAG TPA: nucleotidyltransferase family protein [Candidatus Binatia bacterium]|nr:nucleotidyltransferase family protein [Candidatus Binatia bacterium]